MSEHLEAISSAITALAAAVADADIRLDRVGAYMDNPAAPSLIVQVKHGKILNIAASEAVCALPPAELSELVNAVIFGAYADWYEQVQSP